MIDGSIKKQDVPYPATPQCLKGVLVALLILYLVIMTAYGLYPGLAELGIGAAFGVLSGYLTASGWRGRIERALARKRSCSGDQTLWSNLENYEPGPDVLLWVAGVPIALGALAAHYALWRQFPTLIMPWARFAELPGFDAAGIGGLAFPFRSAAAMLLAFGVVTYLVTALRMLLWYRDLPHTSTASDV